MLVKIFQSKILRNRARISASLDISASITCLTSDEFIKREFEKDLQFEYWWEFGDLPEFTLGMDIIIARNDISSEIKNINKDRFNSNKFKSFFDSQKKYLDNLNLKNEIIKIDKYRKKFDSNKDVYIEIAAEVEFPFAEYFVEIISKIKYENIQFIVDSSILKFINKIKYFPCIEKKILAQNILKSTSSQMYLKLCGSRQISFSENISFAESGIFVAKYCDGCGENLFSQQITLSGNLDNDIDSMNKFIETSYIEYKKNFI